MGQREVLEIMQPNRTYTTSEIIEILQANPNTVRQNLRKLHSSGFVDRARRPIEKKGIYEFAYIKK